MVMPHAPVTGKSGAIATTGRAAGIPPLLANARSTGGVPILTAHIVRVDTSPKGRTLWRRP